MNNLEFELDTAPWRRYLEGLAEGARIPAAQLLSLMEDEDEQSVEDALELCRERCIFPRVEKLPKTYGFGETARILRSEEQLVKKGIRPENLESGDPLRIFLEEVALTPAFGDSQILAEACADGDEEALAQLTNLNLARIIEIAGEHVGHGVMLMDLIQEGCMGLMCCVQDARNGCFEQACNWWIRFFMARAVILQAHAYGVGQRVRQDMEDYRSVDERLLGELGRNATVAEIAQAMHISEENARGLQNMVSIARKLQKALPEEKEEEELPQEEDQAVEDTAYFQTRQRVNEMLSGLTEQEAKVISLRFGLEGGLSLSPEETGRKLGLTPDEVVAVETAAMTKMRKQ